MVTLAVRGDEVALGLAADGAVLDEWTWNDGQELVNEQLIPASSAGNTMRESFDRTPTDVDVWDDDWPPRVDQRALVEIVGAQGSAAEIVAALIAVLHLPAECHQVLFRR